jgi:thiol:disulfide interchange protein DsbG
MRLSTLVTVLLLSLSPTVFAQSDDRGNDAEREAREAQVWEWAEQSDWIQDGDREAPRVLYTFSDPECPYCRRLWEASRPWVEAGEVQLRHIMIGVLAPQSPAKASTLLGAEDPAAALNAHYGEGEEAEGLAQPREIEERVYDNNQLFETLGLAVTPTTLYRDGDRLTHVQGLPDDDELETMMGGEAP